MGEPQHCRICEGTWPPGDHFIGDLGMTKAYLFEDQFFPGWTVLVLKDHRTEIFELTREARTGLMEEVGRAGEALWKTFDARKMNYELLGNQVPHIHWHLIPRLRTDPDPSNPVWCVAHEPLRLASGFLEERIRLLRAALDLAVNPSRSSFRP